MFLNVVGMRTTSEGQLKIEYYIYMELACMFIVVHVIQYHIISYHIKLHHIISFKHVSHNVIPFFLYHQGSQSSHPFFCFISSMSQDGLTGSAWGDWANYTASPLR